MKSIIFLLGPTGVGKTEVSILFAKKIGAEIISADSMQVYREMDIGTAKPQKVTSHQSPVTRPEGYQFPVTKSPDQKQILETGNFFCFLPATRYPLPATRYPLPAIIDGISHYLIDVVEPNEEFNVAKFVKLAEEAIEQIHKKNKIPLVVGGSALYIYNLIKGIFNPHIILKPQLKMEKENSDVLYQKLLEIDPEAADKIHPNNKRRIERALEVYQQTGIRFSQLKKQRKGIENKYKIIKIGLICSRPELYQRVEQRVEEMFEQGLVEEVKRLKHKMGKTAAQALGYKEIISYLNGECSLDEAKDLVKKNTRHFVKHQLSWFRKDKEIKWIEVGGKNKEKIVEEAKYKIDRILEL